MEPPDTDRNGNSEDHFSRLPEDIVFNILSRLTMKEATQTSILSRRWRYSWTFFSGFMDFDASLAMWELKLGLGSKSLDLERYRFVSWVNRVLRLHEGQTLEGLSICCDLDSDSKYEIDSWIKFAMQKRVKKLELDLTSIEPGMKTTGLYPFSSNLNFFKHLSLSSLTTLRLNMVDVTGEILEHLLLSCCPFLEVLSVADSANLVSLKVSGPSLKLKYLEIMCCFSLKNLEISAASLVSFKYYGPVINIPFQNVHHLVEASFGGPFCQLIIDNLQHFSHYSLHIRTLKFDLGSSYLFREFPPDFLTLCNVKHLELATAVSTIDHCLLPYVSLLKACPLLHRFTLKILYENPSSYGVFHKIPEECTHPCLKVVEVLGFQGNAAEVEVVEYLLRNAVVLEKLIINPCSPCYLMSPSQLKFKESEIYQSAYQSAKQHAIKLEAKASPRVEFIVL